MQKDKKQLDNKKKKKDLIILTILKALKVQ